MNDSLSAASVSKLARPDKWCLGGGQRLLWAPSFPQWLDRPGFWDPAHYYNYPVDRGFAVALLDGRSRPVVLRSTSRRWRPDRLRSTYRSPGGTRLVETRLLLSGDVLAVRCRVRPGADAPERVAIWTQFPVEEDGATVVDGAERRGAAGLLRARLRHPRQPDLNVEMALGLGLAGARADHCFSQGAIVPPDFALSPLFDASGPRQAGPAEPGHTAWASVVAPLVDGEFTAALAVGPGAADALMAALELENPQRQAEAGVRRWFSGAPAFACDDPHVDRFVPYRWFGLRLNALPPGDDAAYPHPVICEGPAYFRAPIAYSAPAHLLETRWLHDPSLARGVFRTFAHHQEPEGRFPGYIGPTDRPPDFFYHAMWSAVEALDAVHPDPAFREEAYASLSRYADWLGRTRDPDGTGLCDVHNHYETGQEYMHRYVAVEPTADRRHWGEVFRLQGVDVTVYLYLLRRMLERFARTSGRIAEAARWASLADATGRAVLTRMWDPAAALFSDIDPRTGTRTGVRAAVSFYPYLTDLVGPEHLPGLVRHLADPRGFATPWPVPSSAVDDPYFDPDSRWKGARVNCPWNGRVWPMTNSHVAEAVARTAERFESEALRAEAVRLITRYVHMMCFDGDPRRPNSFEHYHPYTGRASEFRGIDDYQHSWVIDLVVRWVCGLRPDHAGLTVDPYPFDMKHVSLSDVRLRGHRFDFRRDGQRWTLRRNGRSVAGGSVGEKAFLPWD